MAHTRWDQIKALPDQHGYEVQLAYIDGYLLAIEDLLAELKTIEGGWKGNAFSPFREAIKMTRTQVVRIRHETVQTKEALIETRREFLRGASPEGSSKDLPEEMDGSNDAA